MTEFQPWTITGGTLQLNPWPAHSGRVVVTVDVFEDWHGPVADERGGLLHRTTDGWCSTGEFDAKRAVRIADVLRDLFAHIDANPQTTFHLVTEHPERVRKCWPLWPKLTVPQLNAMGSEQLRDYREDRRVSRRPNVTLSALIHTQAEADQRLPVLLELADLCREVYPTCRPVERIDMTKSIGEAFMREHGFTPPFPGVKSVTSNMMPPRIVVSGGPEPMHPDNVRCLRDQAAAAGVAFVFEGWGDWVPACQLPDDAEIYLADELADRLAGVTDVSFARVGSENSGCELDGVRHPWESEVEA